MLKWIAGQRGGYAGYRGKEEYYKQKQEAHGDAYRVRLKRVLPCIHGGIRQYVPYSLRHIHKVPAPSRHSGAEGKIAVDVLSKMEQSLVIELCYDMANFYICAALCQIVDTELRFIETSFFSRQVHRGFDLFRNGAKRKTKYLPMQHGLHHEQMSYLKMFYRLSEC